MTSPQAPTKTTDPSPDAQSGSVHFGFDNTYARLDERFYARLNPTPVAAPRLIKVNVELAGQLGLDADALMSPPGVEILAGNLVAEGSEPLAEAYAGHQFGHFVPQLGDGRAILLGEVIGRDGVRYDIQLKGSGRTPFSRAGDGRAVLGPVLREYIVSEAMAALGVPTARALAAVSTGERVMRETVLPGAIFTRVARSHLRVGTFEFFAARHDSEAVRTLADYAIARHYPEAAQVDQPYRAFLDGLVARQARLVAQWMHLGFIHGVMNTDNTSISGETIDYGPCAFVDAYDPATVFSFIDRHGRYAFGNQPRIAQWNLTRFAEALFPVLLDEFGGEQAAVDAANQSLSAFASHFQAAHVDGLRRKLGLFRGQEGDAALAEQLLEAMAANGADFTLTFRRLCAAAADPDNDASVRSLFRNPAAFDTWAAAWRSRLEAESVSPQARAEAMRLANPAFIPRNHLVEAVIKAAVEEQNVEPFETLLDVVTHPYEDRPNFESYTLPASPEERVEHTYCGT